MIGYQPHLNILYLSYVLGLVMVLGKLQKHRISDFDATFFLRIYCNSVNDRELMNDFDDKMPSGKIFDNFQFVALSDIIKKEVTEAMQHEFFFRGIKIFPLFVLFFVFKMLYMQINSLYGGSGTV